MSVFTRYKFAPVVGIAAIFCLALATLAIAKQFPLEGAGGDANKLLKCPAREYLIGLNGRTGDWIDQIQIICAPFESNGKMGTARPVDPAVGGNGGGPDGKYVPCRAPIDKVEFRLTEDNRQVKIITLLCMHSTWDKTIYFSQGYGSQTIGNERTDDRTRVGEDSGASFEQECPYGEAASGFNVNYGRHVNAIGLTCKPLVLAAAPRDPVADKAANDAIAEERRMTGKTPQQCETSRQRCTARVEQMAGFPQNQVLIAEQCLPFFNQCMTNSAQAIEAAQPKVDLTSFTGVWDTQTSAGETYTLILKFESNMADGLQGVSGFIGNNDAKLDGTLSGPIDEGRRKFGFSFEQPKADRSGKGIFTLGPDGKTISGYFVPDQNLSQRIQWTGTRRD